jgi:hypothetical protein
MDEKLEGLRPEPKISLVVAILIGIALLIVDIAELIPFVGDFIGVPVGALVAFYLIMSKINGTVFIVGTVLDAIPVIQEFPCKTLAWIITVGVDHFAPAAVSEKLEQAGEIAEGKAGEAGAGAGAAAGTEGAAKGATAAAKETEAAAQETRAAAEEGTAAAREEKVGRGGRPSEVGAEPGTEAGETMDEEEIAERAKEEEIEKQMRIGAEVSPEEEAQETAFNPKEVQFREAKPASEAEDRGEEGEEDEELPKAA